MHTVYRWRVLEQDKRGRNRWRLLRWEMSTEEANAWSAANGKRVELVAGSGVNVQPIEPRPSGGVMRTPGM